MDLQALKAFILEASRATYASGDGSIKQKQPDGSTTLEYERGPYRFHDNYFGGEPYGGREVVSYDGKPLWMMVYYGRVYDGAAAGDVYPFLMQSLSNASVDMPYRGPAVFEDGEWRYENQLTGDVEEFSGIERISRDGACVYEARYVGGLVDRSP